MIKRTILPIPMSTLPNSYAVAINLSLDEDYILSAQLVDQNGNTMGDAQTVDLPLESVIIDGRYDAQTQSLILVLENGNEITIPVGGLVSGLQPEITAQNPLSADLLTDGTNNKVFTAVEQTKLAGIAAGAEVNVQANWNESDSSSGSYIQNKPDVATLSGDNTFTGLTTFTGGIEVSEEIGNNFATSNIGAGWLNIIYDDIDSGEVRDIAIASSPSGSIIKIDGNAVVTEDQLATVATTGDYDDLSNKPTIPTVNDATITLQDGNGTALGSFTTNDANNQTITIPAGGGGNEWFGTQAQFDALSSYDTDTDYFISDKIDYNTDIKNRPDLNKYAVKTQVDAKNSEQDSLITNKMEGKFLTEQQYSQITPKEGENYFIEGNTVQMEVTFSDQTTATYNIVID